ncbi:hypothetical protein OHQ88_10520 [Micromonospora zamorensis]|uniref:hypothetical protein n=1 Tax=Micromonospora zamorensis TaxID=709883 RepID=UPI002E1B2D3F
MTDVGLVYVNWGRFVVDCPAGGCHDAREVAPGQDGEVCVAGHPMSLRWPDGAPALLAELQRRPDERTRNWYPEGHPAAVRAGLPQGQSVEELRAESAENGAH